jgi:predicted PurR-regulated permease PerM
MRTDNIIAVSLASLLILAAGFFLSTAKVIIIPMVVALLFSFMLYPVIRFLIKVGVPKLLSILIVLFALFGCLYLIFIILYSSIYAFINQYPWYLEQFKGIYSDFSLQIMQRFNISTTDILLDYDWGSVARTFLLSISDSLTKIVGYIFLIILIMVFLFLEIPIFTAKLKDAYPAKSGKKFIIIIEHITRQIGRYLFVKVIISTVTGFCVWLFLFIIGLDFPLVWGVLAFFLNFIPNIGSTILVIFASIQALVQFYPSLSTFFAVLVSMLGIQILFGNILEPNIQGNKLNLSPVIILVCLIFWGWMWGIVGALLSVPITVTIKIACENIPVLKPVSIMMGTGNRRKKTDKE